MPFVESHYQLLEHFHPTTLEADSVEGRATFSPIPVINWGFGLNRETLQIIRERRCNINIRQFAFFPRTVDYSCTSVGSPFPPSDKLGTISKMDAATLQEYTQKVLVPTKFQLAQ